MNGDRERNRRIVYWLAAFVMALVACLFIWGCESIDLLGAKADATALLEPADALLHDMPPLVLRLVEFPVSTPTTLLV